MFASRVGWYPPAIATGGFGNNAYFPNNSSQYLSVPSVTNLINWKNTTGYTIEYWIYMNAWPGSINPGPGNQDTGGTNYWTFGPGAFGTLEFYFWNPGQSFIKTNSNVMTLNTWHNVCMVVTTSGTTSTVSLYVDGQRKQVSLNNNTFADTQTTAGGVTSTGTPFGMGKYGVVWNGYMDNMRVSNINRYSGASYSLATSPFTVDSNTQLYLICDGTPGSTSFPDSSTFNRTVTNNSNIVTVSSARANHS